MLDILSPPTSLNLKNLLLAPIQSYQSVLTLLALPSYTPLFTAQPYGTRSALAEGIILSIIRNETVIESPEDVDGVLDLCSVLVRGEESADISQGANTRRPQPPADPTEVQGWVARIVHLLRSELLDVQLEVLVFFLF